MLQNWWRESEGLLIFFFRNGSILNKFPKLYLQFFLLQNTNLKNVPSTLIPRPFIIRHVNCPNTLCESCRKDKGLLNLSLLYGIILENSSFNFLQNPNFKIFVVTQIICQLSAARISATLTAEKIMRDS